MAMNEECTREGFAEMVRDIRHQAVEGFAAWDELDGRRGDGFTSRNALLNVLRQNQAPQYLIDMVRERPATFAVPSYEAINAAVEHVLTQSPYDRCGRPTEDMRTVIMPQIVTYAVNHPRVGPGI